MRAVAYVAIAAILAVAGCEAVPDVSLDAPEGWMTDDEGSWWLPGTDTLAAFRDMETLETMGLGRESPVYAIDRPAESQFAVGRFRMVEAIREALLPLYRNHPEIVDSLFRRHVEDDILPTPRGGDLRGLFAEYRREAYRTLMRHFHAPAALTRLGVDVPVPVPDSLRTLAAGEAVEFQVFVGSDGRPLGLRMTRGVHPVLDRIALRAVTEVQWQPAYVLRGNRSVPVDAWVRFAVRYPGLPDAV